MPTDAPFGQLRRELETLTTEAFRPELADIDRLPTLDIARLMNGEDATVPGAVAGQLPRIADAIDGTADRMARGGRLIYAGAGTAGRLGVLDASECPPTFSTPAEWVQGVIAGGEKALRSAVEGAEDDAEAGAADLRALGLNERDVVVGISANGGAPYVLGALEAARAVGAATGMVTCNQAKVAVDHAIVLPVGRPHSQQGTGGGVSSSLASGSSSIQPPRLACFLAIRDSAVPNPASDRRNRRYRRQWHRAAPARRPWRSPWPQPGGDRPSPPCHSGHRPRA